MPDKIGKILKENILKEINVNQVEVNEVSFNKVLDQHHKNGFIIITSYRNENTPQENKVTFEKLKSNIRQSGFSFIPVYGGFIENKGTEHQVEVKEPALLVPNYVVSTSTIYPDTNKLKELGLNLVQQYNQDSFLFKPKDNNKSYYIDKNGNVDMEFSNKSVNDLTQDYFTKLKKNQVSADRRFTFTEKLYLNESANGLSNAQHRYGELFINLKKVI